MGLKCVEGLKLHSVYVHASLLGRRIRHARLSREGVQYKHARHLK